MVANNDEIDMPEGYSLEGHDGLAYLTFWSEDHAEPIGIELSPRQLRRLATEGQHLAAMLLSDTPEPDRHPCASAAEPTARRILRDIEGGHLTAWLEPDGTVRADRAHSRSGMDYARFWGWLEPAGELPSGRRSLRPTDAWEAVRG